MQSDPLPYTGLDCAQCGNNSASLRVFGPALVDDDVLGKVWTIQLARQYGMRAYCTDCLPHQCAVCSRYGLATPRNDCPRFQVAPDLTERGAQVCDDCALSCMVCGVAMNGRADAAACMHPQCRVKWDDDQRSIEDFRRRIHARKLDNGITQRPLNL